MCHYKAKDQSIRIPPEGLVNWHPEVGIRNANVLSLYNHIIFALKNGRKHDVDIIFVQNMYIYCLNRHRRSLLLFLSPFFARLKN